MITFKEADHGFIEYSKDNSRTYLIDPELKTCSCKSYYFTGYRDKDFKCKHIKLYEECQKLIKEANSKLKEVYL